MKYILLFFSLAFSLSHLIGQENRPYRQYATQMVQARLLKGNQENKTDKKNIEKKLTQFHSSNRKITIPVVFHIFNYNGSSLVSEEQVLSQIQALNRDFSNAENKFNHPALEEEGFGKLAVDTEINFCLAGETPNNKTTNGINYYNASNTIWGDDDAIKDKKGGGIKPWKTDDYLNVWVATLVDTVSGYAQMPGGSKQTDGIVIDYRFFGVGGTSIAPYDEGKTLTHLVGNYLGLYDLWSESNYCSDDYVADTPLHNSKNFGCPEYRHISLCTGFPVEMTMNFMDNTDDACQNMFTKGQKRRMQAILGKGGPRTKLADGKIPCADVSSILINPDFQSNLFPSSSAENLDLSMRIFPNPAKSVINIQINNEQDGRGFLEGIDIFGRKIFSKHQYWEKGTSNLTINSNDWQSGTYFFQLKINDELRQVKVIVSK